MDGETAALLFGLGRAQLAVFDPREDDEVLGNLTRAFDYYADSGDVVQTVVVAQYPMRGTIGIRSRIAQLASRALGLVPQDSNEAGRLLLHQGTALAHEEGDYDGALDAFNRAMTIARRKRDMVLEIRTLVATARGDYDHLGYQKCLENGLRAVELARHIDEPHAEVSARFSVGRCFLAMGHLEAASAHLTSVLALAERLRDRRWMASALFLNERKSYLEGDWGVARTFSDRGLAVLPKDPRPLGLRALLEYQSGEFHEGDVYRERLLEVMSLTRPGPNLSYSFPAMVIPMSARISGVPDGLDVAEAAAGSVLANASALPFVACMAEIGLALLATLLGDAEAAGKQYIVLGSHRGMMLPLPAGMAADHLLGLLAQTMGNLDQATTHFEDALAFCRKAGYRPELAWTCHDYADALLARHRPGDRALARSLLEESLAIAGELGMKPLMERAGTRLEGLEVQAPPPPAYPAGLTQREVEVLRLIAAGKTDREIAEELFVSVRTVTTHVSNLRNKIGAANRTEAATYANRNGLI